MNNDCIGDDIFYKSIFRNKYLWKKILSCNQNNRSRKFNDVNDVQWMCHYEHFNLLKLKFQLSQQHLLYNTIYFVKDSSFLECLDLELIDYIYRHEPLLYSDHIFNVNEHTRKIISYYKTIVSSGNQVILNQFKQYLPKLILYLHKSNVEIPETVIDDVLSIIPPPPFNSNNSSSSNSNNVLSTPLNEFQQLKSLHTPVMSKVLPLLISNANVEMLEYLWRNYRDEYMFSMCLKNAYIDRIPLVVAEFLYENCRDIVIFPSELLRLGVLMNQLPVIEYLLSRIDLQDQFIATINLPFIVSYSKSPEVFDYLLDILVKPLGLLHNQFLKKYLQIPHLMTMVIKNKLTVFRHIIHNYDGLQILCQAPEEKQKSLISNMIELNSNAYEFLRLLPEPMLLHYFNTTGYNGTKWEVVKIMVEVNPSKYNNKDLIKTCFYKSIDAFYYLMDNFQRNPLTQDEVVLLFRETLPNIEGFIYRLFKNNEYCYKFMLAKGKFKLIETTMSVLGVTLESFYDPTYDYIANGNEKYGNHLSLAAINGNWDVFQFVYNNIRKDACPYGLNSITSFEIFKFMLETNQPHSHLLSSIYSNGTLEWYQYLYDHKPWVFTHNPLDLRTLAQKCKIKDNPLPMLKFLDSKGSIEFDRGTLLKLDYLFKICDYPLISYIIDRLNVYNKPGNYLNSVLESYLSSGLFPNDPISLMNVHLLSYPNDGIHDKFKPDSLHHLKLSSYKFLSICKFILNSQPSNFKLPFHEIQDIFTYSRYHIDTMKLFLPYFPDDWKQNHKFVFELLCKSDTLESFIYIENISQFIFNTSRLATNEITVQNLEKYNRFLQQKSICFPSVNVNK
ncbi:hypothetical protein DLAC_00656 [Tieghemostelium lacteum]|uniref:Uncharacterized protein n=1 Tax=Tieghemostelium lacteum TaxID=361077 RepID=A0A152AAB0_TIELA|nr:hypothetical protein DLAC_00656 [Tieghemostelium lacteum]|eukprot:KYR03156.1 hypothetical protein DLAC_00656 [Tieghemostelium lacteum]